MMRKVFLLVAVVLLCCIAATAGAVERASEDGEKKPDERLLQKVTYEAERKCVKVIMADLSKLAGVSLRAGSGGSDWQSRDRKMTLFVKDVPLTNLMNSMARVMKFTWSKSKGDPPSYRFYMTRKTLLDAEERRLKQQQIIDDRRAQGRDNLIRAFKDARNLSEQDLAKLKEEDPGLYLYASTGFASSFGEFLEQVPEAAEAVATGRELTLKAANLPPPAQQTLLRVLQDTQNLDSAMSGSQSPSDEGSPNIDRVSIHLNRDSGMMESIPHPHAALIFGSLNIESPGQRGGSLPLLDIRSNLAKMGGKMLARSQAEKRPINEYQKEIEPEIKDAISSDTKELNLGDSVLDHPDDPVLKVKVKLENSDRRMESILKSLAKSTDFSFVADAFGSAMGSFAPWTPATGDVELQKLLADMAEPHQLNWERRGTVLEFRSRYWFVQIAAMVSEDLLDKWRQTLKKTGTLELADLADMARLTPMQLQSNVMGDEVLSGAFYQIISNLDLLKTLSSLNKTQWKAMFTEAGLDLSLLNDEQWKLMQKVISAKNGDLLSNSDARLTFTAKRDQRDKRLFYSFSITSSEVPDPIRWSLDIPTYVEPPKEEAVPERPPVER
ncbi:MAG: hypothetical protein Q7T82_14455 [Armatimonadota bacterium]|nr:hypothetical protein [Armatimonadota bacterium]